MSDYEYVVRVTGARSREGFGESYYAARGADWGLFGEGRDDLRLLTVTGSRADVEALLDEDEAVTLRPGRASRGARPEPAALRPAPAKPKPPTTRLPAGALMRRAA